MSMIFGLLMFICLVPTVWIYFLHIYPKQWKNKKLIFGVKNRQEFQEGETAGTVDQFVKKYRGQALVICVATTALSAAFLLLKGLTAQTAVWTGFVMVAIVAIMIPYAVGNHEMKALKRSLGIKSEEGVSLTDLSNAGSVHSLNPVSIWTPCLLGLAVAIVALLADLKVLPLGEGWYVGTFLMTAMAMTFAATGFLMLVLGYVMDRLKNEVISTDSTVNANYNRAKKKNMTDLMVLFCWVNFVFMILWCGSFLFLYSDLLIIISFAVYMALIMIGILLFVARSKKIEARYEKEMTLLEDDDDQWILGMLYYNPKDKRLNVEKRAGVGGTINYAHPMGKVFLAIGGLSIVATFVAVIFLGMMENTPTQLRVENGQLTCHQIWDEYVIDVDAIQDCTFGEKLSELQLSRIAGVGMPSLLKGDFTEKTSGKCKVFLSLQSECYIKIVTADRTYYVNAATEEETRAAFEALEK
ncbi:MAG: DUF5808 domain-containing protein [Acetatifactor sp.]|nr:DUF5808 domain-containing protein [Acetatifactor sp.]